MRSFLCPDVPWSRLQKEGRLAERFGKDACSAGQKRNNVYSSEQELRGKLTRVKPVFQEIYKECISEIAGMEAKLKEYTENR